MLLGLDVSVVILMGWRRIFEVDWFNDLRGRLLINVHPAILPDYKGYHTEPYIIINGEEEHGITAHHLTLGVDGGEIIHQVRFPISNFSTTASIKIQAKELMPRFLDELMFLILNDSITGTPQEPKSTKVIAPKRIQQDSEIDPKKTLVELYNFIRACDAENYPAFFYVGDQKVFISMWRAKDALREHFLDL